ncbi:UNVERIFIED_CONTAM: hypothetical protein Sradi_3131800 [Sesamum radiatum]|uniref:Aminotransferase class V domain-containing protein n=1 Tax=Sesamum radiatum TaxID=300843 RepID=A0AAW2REM7_SESRA
MLRWRRRRCHYILRVGLDGGHQTAARSDGNSHPSILRERVLKCLNNEERWVVFVGPYEHHSNILSWRQSLAEVVEIGLDHRGLIDMEELRQKLDFYKGKNRPILGSFSACSNVTGICTNTRAVAPPPPPGRRVRLFRLCSKWTLHEDRHEIRGNRRIRCDLLEHTQVRGWSGVTGILLMSKALYRLGSSPPSTCGGGTVNFVNGYNEKASLLLLLPTLPVLYI